MSLVFLILANQVFHPGTYFPPFTDGSGLKLLLVTILPTPAVGSWVAWDSTADRALSIYPWHELVVLCMDDGLT